MLPSYKNSNSDISKAVVVGAKVVDDDVLRDNVSQEVVVAPC
jgi:hypothetical protein